MKINNPTIICDSCGSVITTNNISHSNNDFCSNRCKRFFENKDRIENEYAHILNLNPNDNVMMYGNEITVWDIFEEEQNFYKLPYLIFTDFVDHEVCGKAFNTIDEVENYLKLNTIDDSIIIDNINKCIIKYTLEVDVKVKFI